MKYIMTPEGPILFSPAILHKDMAKGKTVTSAGFVRVTAGNEPAHLIVECYGISDSLGLKPAEGDEDMIEVILNM